MSRIAMTDLGGEYARIFGAKAEAPAPGRQRLCKHCGDWHFLARWPHNCRDERPPRSHLAAPQIAPTFTEFKTGVLNGEVINDRREKRDFMERHELAEYDEGVAPPPEPSQREWERQFVADLKQVAQQDPLNRPPVDVIGQTDTIGAGEIDTSEIEVIT